MKIGAEGDAKVCFDALAEEDELADWFISTVMSSASDLSLYFVNCEFCCVRRSLNLTTHSAMKLYVALKDRFFSNNCNLPPAVLEACLIVILFFSS